MNPLEIAVLEAWGLVKSDIESRKAAKEVAEISEDFSNTAKAVENYKEINFDIQKFSAIQGEAFSTTNLQKVEGGYKAENIVLLEDGYILRRVLFKRGAMKKGFEEWKKEGRKPMLVNNSHIAIEWDLMNGALGAITDMRLEKIDKKKDGEHKYRVVVDIFLDEKNPATQWIVDFGNRMNQLLAKEGEQANIFSVSAEVLLKGIDFVDFAGSFVMSAESVGFTGMGIVFNPANVSSFGTVESLSSKIKQNHGFLGEKDDLVKSPLFNILKQNSMKKEELAELANLLAKASLSEEEKKRLTELQDKQEETEADTNVDETTQDSDESNEETSEGTKDVQTDKSEDDVDGETSTDEPEDKTSEEEVSEGDEPEEDVSEDDKSEEEVSEDEDSDKELKKLSNAKLNKLSSAELLKLTETAISLASKQAKEVAKLSKEVTHLREAMDAAGGEILTRTPNTKSGVGEKLSRAQKVSKYGTNS